jgi:hypothetical protein
MADKKVSKPTAFTKMLRSIPVDRGHDHAEVLLLTCIDFRFFRLISQKMCEEGLTGKYDHFILAGASLGALLDFNADHLPDPKPLLPRIHWQQVFIEHLQLATKLHETIRRVVIIEHRECGAYKAFLDPNGYPSKARERAAHKKQADKLERLIRSLDPRLAVEKWLAGLTPAAIGPLGVRGGETFDDIELTPL